MKSFPVYAKYRPRKIRNIPHNYFVSTIIYKFFAGRSGLSNHSIPNYVGGYVAGIKSRGTGGSSLSGFFNETKTYSSPPHKKYGLLALYIIPAEIGPRLDSAFDLSTMGIALPTGFFDIPHPIQSKNKPPTEPIINSAVWLLRILSIPKVRPITKKKFQ